MDQPQSLKEKKMKTEIKKIPAKVGMMSLVGVKQQNKPVSWGNYFWISDIRIVNMWAENLETLVSNKTLEDKMIELKIYYVNQKTHGLVIDKRIKSEWLYNKLCFTGGSLPPIECIKDMYSIVGDPENEIEKYENPEKYYADRGHIYKNGIVTYKF